MTLPDLHRLIKASALGTLLTLAVLVVFFRTADFARSILILDLLLMMILTAAGRGSFRSLELMRRTLRPQGARTLIYGAGSGGELLVRELLANPGRQLIPVGFIDDDTTKHGRDILGVPVVGTGSDLLEQVMSRGVSILIIAALDLDAPSRARIERVQGKAAIEIWQFRCELAPFGSDKAVRAPLLGAPAALNSRLAHVRAAEAVEQSP